jgi:hypothetical protein
LSKVVSVILFVAAVLGGIAALLEIRAHLSASSSAAAPTRICAVSGRLLATGKIAVTVRGTGTGTDVLGIRIHSRL